MPSLWAADRTPLMLAPMQGLTNRAFRKVVAQLGRPDVVFTEFVRVRPHAKRLIANSDFAEAVATIEGIPLVVQVIGSAEDGVVEAVDALVARGVEHINVNMGCPWGRMTSVLAGGGMFRAPHTVEPLLRELRQRVPGTLSVKTRAGLDDERQLFAVVDAFAAAEIDFLIVHPRTVAQKYRGDANHALTQELVRRVPFPLIANGDVRDAATARTMLSETGAAGLMLGRGAVADPKIFARIRGEDADSVDDSVRQGELTEYFEMLLDEYVSIFHGDTQVLAKFREVLAHVSDPALSRWVKKLKKKRQVAHVREVLAASAQ